MGDRRTLDADGLETFRHLVIQGQVGNLLPSAGPGWSGPSRRRPHQEWGVVPALSVEEIRERLLGDEVVEKLANSLKIKDKDACGSKTRVHVQATDSTYTQPGRTTKESLKMTSGVEYTHNRQKR